jgi:hypothetical protein
MCVCMFRKCGLEREKIEGLGREAGRYIEVENGGIEEVGCYRDM